MSETLILGGGLAGGGAALLLARGGMPVRLLERDTGPRDTMCGEFLSIEAQHDLAAMGIDVDRLGAVPIDRMRLCAGAHDIEACLPFTARGISRRILDETLLEAAASAGARIERGVRAGAIDGGEVSTSAGPRHGSRILVATGKHDLRGARRAAPATRDGYVGFKMHWRAAAQARAAIDRTIELVLFDGGYAGLQPIASEVMNLCLIVRREHFAAIGGTWDDLLASLLRVPALGRSLDDAEPLFVQPLTIANLPYGYVTDADPAQPRHLYRLGDQAAMTASLTGDGMALALRSARLAAGAIIAGEDAQTYHARLRRMVSGQVRRAMWLQRATEAPLALQAGLPLLRLWPRLLGTLASATRLPQWQAA